MNPLLFAFLLPSTRRVDLKAGFLVQIRGLDSGDLGDSGNNNCIICLRKKRICLEDFGIVSPGRGWSSLVFVYFALV